MTFKIEWEKVTPCDLLKGEDQEDTALLKEMCQRARTYISSFSWCEGIEECYFGLGVGGIVAIYLFKLAHSRADVDDWVWVVVGNVPPAYITLDNAINPAQALDGYIGAMREWVNAVMDGQPVDGLIPVNAPPTKEWATKLDGRLTFIHREILVEHYFEDLAD